MSKLLAKPFPHCFRSQSNLYEILSLVVLVFHFGFQAHIYFHLQAELWPHKVKSFLLHHMFLCQTQVFLWKSSVFHLKLFNLTIITTHSEPNCIELRHKRLCEFQILQNTTVFPTSWLFAVAEVQRSISHARVCTIFAFLKLFFVGIKHGKDEVFYNLSSQLRCHLIQSNWSLVTSWLHLMASRRDGSTLWLLLNWFQISGLKRW
jgi:hypothetical protein